MKRVLAFGLALSFFAFRSVMASASFEKGMMMPEVRAMWLSFPFWDLSRDKKESVVRYLASRGINKVFLSVYDNGVARYDSKILPGRGLATARPDGELIDTVKLFRSHGIEPAAFFEGGMSVWLEHDFSKKHPELLQDCGAGGRRSGEHGGHLMAFLDPSLREARDIVLAALEEIARHPAGFREIQLDRFRYTHWEWKLCKAADGSSDPRHVNEFVKEAYHHIKKVKPGLHVSASPVGSYGFWKLNQRWGEWVRDGYIDSIVSQAYIEPVSLKECARGTPPTQARAQTTAIFKAELASLTGQPSRLEAALQEFRKAGGKDEVLELEHRRPMVAARARELSGRRVPIIIGYMAHQFDDSECIQDQMLAARSQGYRDATLWVSGVGPRPDGSPNPEIDDNLSLLRETLWKRP